MLVSSLSRAAARGALTVSLRSTAAELGVSEVLGCVGTPAATSHRTFSSLQAPGSLHRAASFSHHDMAQGAQKRCVVGLRHHTGHPMPGLLPSVAACRDTPGRYHSTRGAHIHANSSRFFACGKRANCLQGHGRVPCEQLSAVAAHIEISAQWSSYTCLFMLKVQEAVTGRHIDKLAWVADLAAKTVLRL